MNQPAASPQEVPVAVAAEENNVARVKPEFCGQHTRGLILVGLFKLCKAILAGISSVAAYHLTHIDIGALAERLVSALPIDPMGRLARSIMDQADNQAAYHLRHLGEVSLVLAVLYLIEGTGLMAEKVWAEYLTVVMTAAAMPYEVYELVERYSDVKLAVLVLNAAVVVYLAILLRQKMRQRRECA